MSDETCGTSNVNNCPRCGSGMFVDGPNEISWHSDSLGWTISCDNCKFAAHAFQEENVIREWNTNLNETAIETSRRKLIQSTSKEIYVRRN